MSVTGVEAEADLVERILRFVNDGVPTDPCALEKVLEGHPYLDPRTGGFDAMAGSLPTCAERYFASLDALSTLRSDHDLVQWILREAIRDTVNARIRYLHVLQERMAHVNRPMSVECTWDRRSGYSLTPVIQLDARGLLWYGVALLVDHHRELAKGLARCPSCFVFFRKTLGPALHCSPACSDKSQRNRTSARVRKLRTWQRIRTLLPRHSKVRQLRRLFDDPKNRIYEREIEWLVSRRASKSALNTRLNEIADTLSQSPA